MAHPYELGKFKGWPVSFASLNNVKNVKKYGLICFVWRDEGNFENDKFIFNEGYEGYEPLMIDLVTSNVIMTCYNALTTDEAKKKFMKFINGDRGSFAQLVNFCWSRTTPKV